MAENILIRPIEGLGGGVLCLPAMWSLLHAHPGSEISIMATPVMSGLYAMGDARIIDLGPVEHLSKCASNFERMYVLSYFPRPAWKSLLDGIPGACMVAGTQWEEGRRLVYQQLLDTLAEYGVPTRAIEPIVAPTNVAMIWAEAFLGERGVIPSRDLLVAITPNTRLPAKDWSADRYASLAEWLVDEFHARILILSHEATPAMTTIMRVIGTGGVPVIGEPIERVAALLRLADLHIGADCGPGHLAAAVGCATVSLFGPTSPELWRPAGGRAVVVINRQVECPSRSCGYEAVRRGLQRGDMEDITLPMVVDGVLSAITRIVGWGSKHGLDRLAVSPDVELHTLDCGVIVRNTRTMNTKVLHVESERIENLLSAIASRGSYRQVAGDFPESVWLLNALLEVRALGPGRS